MVNGTWEIALFYIHFSDLQALFKVDNVFDAVDHFSHGGIDICNHSAYSMLRTQRYAAAAAFTFSLIMYGLSFNQRNSHDETIFYAGSATNALF